MLFSHDKFTQSKYNILYSEWIMDLWTFEVLACYADARHTIVIGWQ